MAGVGNAAGTGARMALLNKGYRREIEELVRSIEKIETALEPRFQEHFVNAMAFPEQGASRSRISPPRSRCRERRSAGDEAEGRRRRGGRAGRAAAVARPAAAFAPR